MLCSLMNSIGNHITKDCSGPEEGHTNWSGQEVGVVKENAPLIDVIHTHFCLFFYKQLCLLCKIKCVSYFQFCIIYIVFIILSNLYNNELVSY